MRIICICIMAAYTPCADLQGGQFVKFRSGMLLAAVASAPLVVGRAHAQVSTSQEAQAQDKQGEALPEVVAEGETVQPPVTLGSGVESGTTTIERQDIEMRTPGSGDVNELLKILPTAQFQRSQTAASRSNVQDLRPADLAISGGLYYDNRITLDGIDVRSRLDVTNTNAQNGEELAGPSSQALWVDSELVGKVTVRDSNVSAEYGSFTGGALAIETRDPKRSFSATATVAHTSDDLTHLKLSKSARDALEGAEIPTPPEFEKWRYGATVDVPVTADGGLLFGYNRSEARVTYFAHPRYASAERHYSSTSENMLVRGVYDLDTATKLSGQFVYTPYTSESGAATSIDNTVLSKGGGITGKLEVDHHGALDWKLAASYAYSDTSRTAPPVQYNIASTVPNGGFCTNSLCTTGGIGDLNQTQRLFGANGSIGTRLGAVQIRGGFDYSHIQAHKWRPEEVRAYSRGMVDARVVCVNGDSLDCVTGQYALGQYNYSRVYDANVDLDAIGAWAEAEAEIGAVTLRGGLRYDYESFLGNHVFAPRFTAAWRLPWEGWELSAGANRYYGTSMVSYALRERQPALQIYQRNGVSSGGSLLYSNAGWFLYQTSNGTTYSNSNLKTPYADELTAALGASLLGGKARLKGIYREGRNAFAQSPMQSQVVDNGNGTTTTKRFYTMTNDGETSYRGVSLEWARSFGKHAISLSFNYSKTKTTNPDYMEGLDDIIDPVPILFQGEPSTTAEIAQMNRSADFSSPFLANATWSANWLRDRVRTNLSVYYRSSFRRIEDTGVNQRVDGVTYDVYDWVRYSGNVDAAFNVQADVIRTALGTLTLDARVENLLDTVSGDGYASLSEPYQYGRSAWFGLKFRY